MDDTTKDRREALDQFAQGTEETTELVPIAPASGPAPQVWGAQNVAVKRDERIILQKIRTLAAAASTEWFYRFPVKNKRENRIDHIEGPSIKLANDLARIFGNCDIDCRATDLGTHILFQARFIDLETGYSLTRPFQQRKGASKMGADQDRQADITFQIGASKAIRNVIVNALQTYADFALSEAKEALVERIGADLPKWRERTLARLKEYPVDIHRVEAVVGRPAKEWVATDLARVIASMKAVADGMATIDETFPPRTEEPSAQPASRELDQFAEADRQKAGSGATAEPAAPDPTSPAKASGAASASDLRLEAVEKIIGLATEQGQTPEFRLEALSFYEPLLRQSFPEHETWCETMLRTAEDVIRERTDPKEARRYLKGLTK